MLFSQRHGFTSLRKQLQLEDIDQDLRNCLWNAFKISYWDRIESASSGYVTYDSVKNSTFKVLIYAYWHSFFKKPVDSLPERLSSALSLLREYFFSCPWYRVYDFIEFTIAHPKFQYLTPDFPDICNKILEEENAGYRIIAGHVVAIIASTEVEAVEQALASSDAFSGARIHLETAVKLLADRNNPDYRNSIKESISAVESVCQVITANPNATLGKALGILEKQKQLHGSLKEGFSKLYGYTNDSDGIRHALLEEPNVSFSDAKFMLIACSGFVNYLIGKVAELRIELEKDN
ncbi:hypothetical protein NIES2135_45120 [Leptolyngbya boryana NIES-2135]|jgi:hypothetical protein|uniref:HEPN AbiJ-N-terminal domain-containing protein n=1 Tax=Leptolyngbya boryana NIES-2135 TaxID=1973484 RepID=A0A1Z4JLL1_LEPBY|nr:MULTISPECIES: hypothetical protein [Leptolyngbya]BAY57642.1 hypothetical protein NIES2135_45120 [Leptolyngbya boryana NIES-2135]MBD2367597.1 hypothetical protein [Leptolyngbya sp. FACHB-161]MBD2374121.1 hypothetical protein [Leptolyngbya sp. FACHB-238]MBD2398746.1 hypothetical protein [Leptolyngbya sp. FACHB-239]MBD2404970.1 hypothetical protein [Leptolyngbya sp. FACHB-402]